MKAPKIFNPEQKTSTKPLYLTNTLSGEKEVFEPLVNKKVRMYNCGPTVYDYPHIGNFRAFIFADVLRRVFEYNHYTVKQVMNLTDVGHLVSDEDEGEDKVEKKAKQEGKSVAEIVEPAIEAFFSDLKALGAFHKDTEFPKASEYIDAQIALLKTLDEKGYTYKTSDGIYFDTSKFEDYGKLGNINVEGLKEGARIAQNPEKLNPTDFALWKFSRLDEKRQQEWQSPWGVGFPGWHLECSALAMRLLGKHIDVHTGGIDHIPTHHNNEIAQTESATGTTFSNYWMHSAFITIEGRKISKSLGNTITLRNISDRGISPLAYRYWILTAHHSSQVNFTWDALEGAQTALFKLHRYFVEELGTKNGRIDKTYREKFHTYINDNLELPQAVALLFDLMKDENVSDKDKRATFLDFDRVLGLGLAESSKKMLEDFSGKKQVKIGDIPKKVTKMLEDRETARKEKDWEKADTMRDKITELGYTIDDTEDGAVLVKNSQ